MEICINDLQDKIKVEEELFKLLERVALKALAEQGAGRREGEISLAFVDNAYIHELNKNYRDKDKPTDVLSFPMDDINNEQPYVLLGDIIISLEKAKEQAEEYGHSFEREMAFLTVHGVLHLLGHDHEGEEEREWMEKEQRRVLELLGISREY